jgi:hypothetical protein
MTRAYNTATTQQNSGGAVAGVTAGKNAVINGGMDIWQRGTSMAGTSTAFSADRWQAYRSVTGSTFSRQATGDTTNLPDIQYCARIQRDSGNTSSSTIYFSQSIENANSISFIGKTYTVSFWARKGATMSTNLDFYVGAGTGTDGNITTGSGWTGNTYYTVASIALTTTWTRYTYSGTVATDKKQMGIIFGYGGTGTAGATDYFEVTGVQLELGNAATPFSRNGGTIQGELAACQRYYYRLTSTDDVFSRFAFGSATASTNGQFLFNFPVQMRVKPSALDTSAASTLSLWDGATDSFVTAISGMTRQSVNNASVDFTTAATMTQYRPYWAISRNTTSAYVGFSAEL